MKIIKSFLLSVTYLLAIIVILISTGSAICKYVDLPKDSFIQTFGYIPYYWILVLSSGVLLLFLFLRNFRGALSYLGILIIFTLLLDDFSLKYLHRTYPDRHSEYDSLSVVAYNVHHYSAGIGQISQFLKNSDFDLILLSESVLTNDKLDSLKRNLPDYSIITDNGHDLSILSKYPVLNCRIIELPTYLASLSSRNDIDSLRIGGIHRSFVHAVINVNGIFTNVLSLRLIAGRPKNKSVQEGIRWGKYLLKAQNEELSVFLNYLQTLKGPVIFGGDLNVSPNTEIIHRINHYAEDAFLGDHAFGSFTFKVSFPTMRLDYLFHSKEIIAEKSNIVKTRTTLSDHFPISAEFLIPKTYPQTTKNNSTKRGDTEPSLSH
jgi:endonuclease/exonuclease/phosphatase (EEP) superfamily protein YafD